VVLTCVIPAKAHWLQLPARMRPKADKPLAETIFFVNYKHLSENRGSVPVFGVHFFSLTNAGPSI
jgi:hypothetical protein